MAKAKKHLHAASRVWSRETPPTGDDWRILGKGISRLPPRFWEPRMFFLGAPDRDLQERTGVFPRTIKAEGSTHPIYVLAPLGNFGFRVCPCTSKFHRGPYVRKGCILEVTGEEMDRNSHLLPMFSFPLPLEGDLPRLLRFRGIVPSPCIVEA